MLDSFYDELLPYALQCGMTVKEFWNEEPRLLSSYIKKHEKELDEINYQSWLVGLYVYKAVGTVLGNAFSTKSSINNTYFEKPLEEFESNYIIEYEIKKESKDISYRKNVNYWSKIGKKGV